MFFKKSTSIFTTITSLLLCSASFSYADDAKITVVETRKIIENSMAHQSILAQVQKKNEEFRDKVQKEEADLKKKYSDLETKKNALSQEAIDKKNEEISKEVAELQKKSYGQHSLLEDSYRNATQSVIDKTSEIVKQQAEQKGYSIVIEKGAVVFSQATLDITDVVLEELNKSMPKVDVKFEEQKQEDKNVEAAKAKK